MIKTSIYGLNQPQGNDAVDIEVLNENIRKIDDILNLKIDNSKKSDSVTLGSSDSVATSKAVKAAYDKGVEALGKAGRNETQLTDYTKITPYAGTTTGVANAYVISTPVITALIAGMSVCVKIHTASTTASTLNWCGMGAKYIRTIDNIAYIQLINGGVYNLRYDGVSFIMLGINERASETVQGIVELATTAEVTAGTDVYRAVTPKGLKDQGYFNLGNYGSVINTGSSLTLDVSHANKVLLGATAMTITIPTNVAVPFPIGTQITVINWTTTVTFVPSAGVNLLSKDSKRSIDGLNASATLIKVSTDYWVLIGALK